MRSLFPRSSRASDWAGASLSSTSFSKVPQFESIHLGEFDASVNVVQGAPTVERSCIIQFSIETDASNLLNHEKRKTDADKGEHEARRGHSDLVRVESQSTSTSCTSANLPSEPYSKQSNACRQTRHTGKYKTVIQSTPNVRSVARRLY